MSSRASASSPRTRGRRCFLRVQASPAPLRVVGPAVTPRPRVGSPVPVQTGGTCVHTQLLSHVQLFATPWTTARQAPLSMGFSRQECWSGLPFPSPGDLPDPGIKPTSLALQADSLPSVPPGTLPMSMCDPCRNRWWATVPGVTTMTT